MDRKLTGAEVAAWLNSLHDHIEDETAFTMFEELVRNLDFDGMGAVQATLLGYIHMHDLDAVRVLKRMAKRYANAEDTSDALLEGVGGLVLDMSGITSLDQAVAYVREKLTEFATENHITNPPEPVVVSIATKAWESWGSRPDIDEQVEEFAKALEKAKPEDLGQA